MIETIDPGILPRCIDYLYSRTKEMTKTASSTFIIRATCMEIYNDQVYDLLEDTKAVDIASRRPLTVRWSNGIGFFVENLKIMRFDTANELQAIVDKSIKKRKTASHKLNDSSNRRYVVLIYNNRII